MHKRIMVFNLNFYIFRNKKRKNLILKNNQWNKRIDELEKQVKDLLKKLRSYNKMKKNYESGHAKRQPHNAPDDEFNLHSSKVRKLEQNYKMRLKAGNSKVSNSDDVSHLAIACF